MKIFLISDNQDSLTGLRLTGVDGTLARSIEIALKEFEKAIIDPELGILLITEKLASQMTEKIHEFRINNTYPLIVEIPNSYGTKRKKDFITSYINEAIGVKL